MLTAWIQSAVQIDIRPWNALYVGRVLCQFERLGRASVAVGEHEVTWQRSTGDIFPTEDVILRCTISVLYVKGG